MEVPAGPSRPTRPRACWVSCLLLAVRLAAAQTQTRTIVNSSAALIDGVFNFAANSTLNATTTLLLSPMISMTSSLGAYPAANSSSYIAPGTLVLNSVLGGLAPATLDCGMQSGLTAPWDNTTSLLKWQNLVLTNLCSEWLIWNPTYNISILSSSNTWLLPRSRIVQTHLRTNVTMYVPYSEVLSMTYWQIMNWVPFPPIYNLINNRLQQRVPPTNSNVTDNGMFSISIASMFLPGGEDVFVEYRATNNPLDPIRLEALGGTLMPHRFCNGPMASGPLMSEANLSRNMSTFPMWISDNSTLQADMLAIAKATVSYKPNVDPTITMMLVTNCSYTGAAVTLRSDVLLQGPMNPEVVARLSLNNKNNVLGVGSAATLYITKLWLTELVSRALPSSPRYSTAMPIWAINANLSPVQVQLYNVTLVVPQDDFAALLSACNRGNAWQSGAHTTAPLMAGISTFITSPALPCTRASLLFANYTGFGINGAELRLYPEGGPLPDSYPLPDPLPPPPPVPPMRPPGDQTTRPDSSDKSAVALGVGIGLGVTLLVLLVTLAIMYLRKRKQSKKYAAAAASVDGEAGYKATHSDIKTNCAQGNSFPNMPSTNTFPAREAIHKAVSQAQEAMKPQNSVAVGDSGIHASLGSLRAGMVPPPPVAEAAAAVGAGAAALGVSASTDGSGMSLRTGMLTAGGTEPGTSAVGAGGEALGSSLAQPLNVQAGGTVTATAMVAAVVAAAGGDSGHTPTPAPRSGDSIKVLDPLKAVQERAGQIQRADADKLTLISVLGRGAWGTVYKGTWRGLTVAVKTVLFSEREDGDTTLPHERAIMEAAVCTSVAHRNVVATYHYDIKPVRMVTGGDEGLQVEAADDPAALGITDWKLFLVQEWCNSTLGQALRSWLLHKKATREPLIDLLLELLLDVASGVLYLHDKNIIHGDLKPENVMLKTDTTAQIGVVAKITDFGLSTTLAPTATHVSNYKSGTPFYVAPEVTAQGRTTKASDTYSMGVLMWEAYCCTPPWIKVGSEYQANSRFPTFSSSCPQPYLRLAKSCLHHDPKQRPTFTTIMATLRGMLDAWQQGYDTLEAPPHALQAAATAAAAAAGSAASVVHTSSVKSPSAQGPTAVAAVPQQPLQVAGVSAEGKAGAKAGAEAVPVSADAQRHDSAALLSEWVSKAQPKPASKD